MDKPPHFGPTRGELWFRLAVSVGGLGFVAIMVALRGIPSGPGLIEVLGIPLVLFGGTTFWSVRRLIVRDHPEKDVEKDGL